MNVYDKVSNLSIMYSHIIDDRYYYMDGDTLVINPVYNETQAVIDHLSINPKEVDMSELERIVMSKLK
jgi:hypothetical protein